MRLVVLFALVAVATCVEVKLAPQVFPVAGTEAMTASGLPAPTNEAMGTMAMLQSAPPPNNAAAPNSNIAAPQFPSPGVPGYISGLPQPYPMASPLSLGHLYGGYGFPVHPIYRAMHAMIGAPPPPLIPYGAPYYPPYA